MAPQQTSLSTRPQRGLTALVGLGVMLLVAVMAVFGTLVHRQQQLTERAREDALWAAYQLDRETTKFERELAATRRRNDAEAVERLAQRFDILFSRVDYLDQGDFPRLFATAEVREPLAAAKSNVRRLAPLVDELSAGRLPTIVELEVIEAAVAAVRRSSEAMLLAVNHLKSHQVVEEREYTQHLYLALGAGVVLLTVTLVAVIALLRVQLRALGAAHLRTERLKHDLERALALAEEGTRAKSAFLATMSHEIRTPMNGVVGMASLLASTDLSPDQVRYVGTIEECSNALLTLIDDVLDFSKLESGRLEVSATPVALADLAHGAVEIVRGRAEAKGLALAVVLAPDLPSAVVTDAARVRQVLLNLLGNATKFTEAGSVTLAVRSKPGPDTDTAVVRFEVVDTGIGIAPEAMDRLFREFSQVDASINRRYGGTGLGLAISRKIIDALEGEIGVVSTPGVGSTFFVEIPVEVLAGPGELPKAAREPAAAAPAASLARRRILLVEDNTVNQEVARALLVTLGQEVDVAGNGEIAVGKVAAGGYDLVLMDMQMPVMDGLEATRRIRELDGPASAVRIVGLTANAFISDRNKCFEAGMDDFVTKPIDRAKLEAVLARGAGGLVEAVTGTDETTPAAPVSAAADTGEARRLLEAELGPEKVERLYRLFWMDAAQIVEGVARASDGGDLETAARLMHTLKGSAGNLGFAMIAEAASRPADRDGKALRALLAAMSATLTTEMTRRSARAPGAGARKAA